MLKPELPIVFGQETEYSLVIFDDQGCRVAPALASEMFMCSARAAVPNVKNSFDGESIFLGNGSRLYVDRGDKIEMATPECRDGAEVTAHHIAGRRVLAGIARQLEQDHANFRVHLYSCPVDYVTGTTSGCHESHLVATSPSPKLAQPVLPFLVSRMILTGAGGLVPNISGAEFSLSPRAAFLTKAVSETTTRDRALFCLKDEPLAAKYARVHLVLGESLCCPQATYLKFATTAAVLRLADLGRLSSAAVDLSDPVFALRRVAADPSCKAPLKLAAGGTATPIEIQRHYLEQVRQAIQNGLLPAWMATACRSWGLVLASLECGDRGELVSKLDWVLKRKLFDDYVNTQALLSQDELQAWTLFLKRVELITSFKCLRRNMNRLTFDLVMEELNRDFFGIQAVKEVLKVLKRLELTYADYKLFSEVRDRLWEYDMRLGEVRGIYHELERDGAVDLGPVSEADILQAQVHPPPWGRAKIRGDWIREHGASARMAIADWTFIRTADRYLDLRDVFETEERWTTKASTPNRCINLRRRLRLSRLLDENRPDAASDE